MCIGLLSDIRDNVDPRSILDDDPQRVVEVDRIGSRLLRGCVTADEHNVLADDVEGDDDGLADERGAAAAILKQSEARKRLNLILENVF